ncbi:MAG: indole-3-glycerol phosphate synthase TrpC [Clostridiales bacterium]|nr:indole-3-glycerol phosphate synthase TrpC [Clostridiales bacterium]
MTILEQLTTHARARVAQAKQKIPLSEMQRLALQLPKGDFSFERALKRPGLSFICECKKASPSKGVIAPDYPYLEIAKAYEAGGADAISVLTEPRWFLGHDIELREIASAVTIPCLRKDFTIDPYMIYEARVLGASAVLLICSVLEREQLEEYLHICNALGLSALVEAHNQSEVHTALSAGAKIIGVNNRNLSDFSVDVTNSAHLRREVPKDVLFVSESGVKDEQDVIALCHLGADAVLIGEMLMRAPDKQEKLKKLRLACSCVSGDENRL